MNIEHIPAGVKEYSTESGMMLTGSGLTTKDGGRAACTTVALRAPALIRRFAPPSPTQARGRRGNVRLT